jgi:hypothetical protein
MRRYRPSGCFFCIAYMEFWTFVLKHFLDAEFAGGAGVG